MSGMNSFLSRAFGWCALLLCGAALAAGVAWLTHLVHVPLTDLLAAGAALAGLAWLVALVTLPWNLYFAAHRALAGMALSRERGIRVRDADEAEASRLARRMLAFALGAHACTALAAATVAYVSGSVAGYYVAGFFLLSTAFRPAAAYFAHVRARIRALTRQSTHPRDDVAALHKRIDQIKESVADLRAGLKQTREALRGTDARLADSIAHTRQVLANDLVQLQGVQAADRTATRSQTVELGRRIDDMVRRIESTLDGVTDQQELLAGLHALVRMVRAEPG
jgi:hypothetical protein